MIESKKWYKHVIRVRYQETDQMGVVYHTHYLNWFEIGRTEMIRALGIPYRQLEERGLLLPVVEAEVKFSQPAKYDDQIAIFTRITHFSNVRLQFESEIRRATDADLQTEHDEPAGEKLASGSTKHIWVNKQWKPVRIDREAPDLYALLQQV